MLNVIVNRKARRVGKLIAKTEKRLAAAGIAYRIFYTDKPGAAFKYARSLSSAGERNFSSSAETAPLTKFFRVLSILPSARLP